MKHLIGDLIIFIIYEVNKKKQFIGGFLIGYLILLASKLFNWESSIKSFFFDTGQINKSRISFEISIYMFLNNFILLTTNMLKSSFNNAIIITKNVILFISEEIPLK